MKVASRSVCATEVLLAMLEFEKTEEGSEVYVRRTALSKGFSPASWVWKSNLSLYNFVKYCTVLSHLFYWLDKFSQATSFISVKCALAYMFSTNLIKFSLSVHRTLITTHAAALRVSSRVYFLMWTLGVSDHGVQRYDLAYSFYWF